MSNVSFPKKEMKHYLNSNGLHDVHDYTFQPGSQCAISLNPKGFDSPRALAFRLDRPSQTAGVCETTVYTDPSFNNYHAGSPYGSQSKWTSFPVQNRGRNINQLYKVDNSQIRYYVDKSIQAPFHTPVFDMPSRAALIDYVDPMGSWKPHYTFDIVQPARYSCLSFINDTSFQREDIMARQQAIHNQQRSEPFFNL